MVIDLSNPADLELFKRAAEGKRIGVTSGAFDLLHYYHLVYLQKCARKCDILVVGVDSDDLVRRDKGQTRPLIPENHRVAMVEALKFVNAAFVMDDPQDFGEAVRTLKAQVIFKNDPKRWAKVEGAEDAKLVVIPDVQMPDSTSQIVEEIVKRHDTEANIARGTSLIRPKGHRSDCKCPRCKRIDVSIEALRRGNP